ncbi:DNA-binding response regulator [Arthrobacter sp. NPDC093139]|uniref:helix-turn-helix transcriptional regulator n=1 Tax=Arthrobacter sp. NPDC093139 TaxID=3363945 RepID=UPI003803C4AF
MGEKDDVAVQEISVVVAVLETQLQAVLDAIFRFNVQTRAVFSRAESPLELAADCRAHQADLIVVDARSSHEAHNLLPVLTFYPQAHLMVFIDVGASEAIRDVMNAGARGILTSDASAREIQRAISDVAAGHVFLSRSALLGLLEVLRRTHSAAQPVLSRTDLPALTGREREVVECLGKGQSNRDIAKELGVSEAAVKGHLSRIMVKWCVQDRLQVLVAAFEAGVLRVGELGGKALGSGNIDPGYADQLSNFSTKSISKMDNRLLLSSSSKK